MRAASLFLALFLLLAAAPAGAQSFAPALGAGRFLLGPIEWTPTLVLREAGVDSNALNTSMDRAPVEDRVIAFTPRLEASGRIGVVELSSRTGVGAVYYERLSNERALNGQAAGRIALAFQRFRPGASLQWERTKERSGNELDVRAPQTSRNYTLDLSTRLATRTALVLTAGRQRIEYDGDATFHDNNIATQLNRDTLDLGAALRIDVTPLTTVKLEARRGRDEFLLNAERQVETTRATAGFEFSPDAVIRGQASIGYLAQRSRGDSNIPFTGWTATVNLGYSLLGRTKFDARFARETTFSVLAGEDYYLSTRGGLDVLHALAGPIDLVGRISRERMDYSVTRDAQTPRLDQAMTLGGGISFRVSDTSRVGIEYERTRRDSTSGPSGQLERRRLYTTITYGF